MSETRQAVGYDAHVTQVLYPVDIEMIVARDLGDRPELYQAPQPPEFEPLPGMSDHMIRLKKLCTLDAFNTNRIVSEPALAARLNELRMQGADVTNPLLRREIVAEYDAQQLVASQERQAEYDVALEIERYRQTEKALVEAERAQLRAIQRAEVASVWDEAHQEYAVVKAERDTREARRQAFEDILRKKQKAVELTARHVTESLLKTEAFADVFEAASEMDENVSRDSLLQLVEHDPLKAHGIVLEIISNAVEDSPLSEITQNASEAVSNGKQCEEHSNETGVLHEAGAMSFAMTGPSAIPGMAAVPRQENAESAEKPARRPVSVTVRLPHEVVTLKLEEQYDV